MPTASEMLGESELAQLIELVAASGTTTPSPSLTSLSGNLSGLGLHQRTDAIAAALIDDHGAGFTQLAKALLRSEQFTGWMTLPVGESVVRTGGHDIAEAMELLRCLTPLLSSEFAARKMLALHGSAVLPAILEWVTDEDPHVRRLASECTRPRLPWGQRMDHLALDDAPTRSILDDLHDDESEYVRLSVANHLNDVSKSNPARALEHARGWQSRQAGTTPRVITHGLRTLIKSANQDALSLVGIDCNRRTTVVGPELARPTITLGESVEFSFNITNEEATPTRVVVDYIIHFVKANGTRSPKTFKLSTRTLAPNETWEGKRSHPIVPINTRKYYAGEHTITLQVNGTTTAPVPFLLKF